MIAPDSTTECRRVGPGRGLTVGRKGATGHHFAVGVAILPGEADLAAVGKCYGRDIAVGILPIVNGVGVPIGKDDGSDYGLGAGFAVAVGTTTLVRYPVKIYSDGLIGKLELLHVPVGVEIAAVGGHGPA